MAVLVTPSRLRTVAGQWGRGCLLAWCALGLAMGARAAALSEYQLKAVFLYNFAQFVDWPPRAFPNEQTPLVIGVLGDDPFGASLDEAVRGETVNGRSLVVQRFHRVEEVGACHVLFVSRSESGRLEHILAHLRGRSILTVSDADGFTEFAGMIRFVTENNKIRLRINVEAARAADLTISSKLLRPAQIVSSAKG